MPKRRSSSNDPFGLGSFGLGSGGLGGGSSRGKRSNEKGGFGDFGLGDGLRNYQKRATLSNNRMKGKMAEESFRIEQNLQGNDCRKIHKGGDFVVQKRDIFGNRVGKPTVHEVKTGNAKLSSAQKRRKARLGNSRYKVERYY
jgi:hypothetical protein